MQRPCPIIYIFYYSTCKSIQRILERVLFNEVTSSIQQNNKLFLRKRRMSRNQVYFLSNILNFNIFQQERWILKGSKLRSLIFLSEIYSAVKILNQDSFKNKRKIPFSSAYIINSTFNNTFKTRTLTMLNDQQPCSSKLINEPKPLHKSHAIVDRS